MTDSSLAYVPSNSSIVDRVRAFGVVILSLTVTLQHKLDYKTSSTESELAAIREAVQYVIFKAPQNGLCSVTPNPLYTCLRTHGDGQETSN